LKNIQEAKTKEERRKASESLLEKNPDMVPIILEPHKKCKSLKSFSSPL
jgi:hypothetical protein